MKPNGYRYIFGPVPSRRFGRSLGIDLTPHKTCSLNCVFCQLGPTPVKTLERKVYVPTTDVIAEIDHWLESDGEADYLTLSGSGEPTLHTEFGRVLARLGEVPIPSALLTNGTLLHLPEVREAAKRARVVKVSLSAWDQNSFERINRPHSLLRFKSFLNGLKRFRKAFGGRLWLEVFILAGINANPTDVEKIARLSRELKPERIHLNTVARPPAEPFAVAVPAAQLKALASLFDPPAQIVADFSRKRSGKVKADDARILSMIKRRPCTIQQIEAAFGMHINEVSKTLGYLMRRNQIRADVRSREVYYSSL
jgi:wyosine [tRNA(Phe)-imidazoG37] synthetase (radical SAM superfamily)